MKENAYAKINLTLEVLGRYINGYHGISSVFQQISLHDTIVIEKTNGETKIQSNWNIGKENTVTRAINAFENIANTSVKVSVKLTKRIPMQSGLGGGSSDAATVLKMLNAMYENPIEVGELKKIATLIGADVPYFFTGHTALVSGKGEKVKQILANLHYYVILCLPEFGMPTKLAYTLSDKHKLYDEGKYTQKLLSAIRKKLPIEEYLYNHFEVIYQKEPDFKKLIDFQKRIEAITKRKAHLSGSGSAFFILFQNQKELTKAAENLKENGISIIESEFV